MTFTKAHLVESVMAETGFSRKKSFEVVDALLGTLKVALESGEDVLISGFGKFCVHQKQERRGRNPATGEQMMLRPRKVVSFKCSGKLKAVLNR